MKKHLYIISLLVIIFSCKKEDIAFSGDLNFSNDTVIFDTVFASVGSITKTLTIYNNKDYNIITNIQLNGSSAANFRINVDGISESAHENILIPSNDSIFIFVEVTIDPSSNNLPYILTDSIVFYSENYTQSVKLIAWGQDAHFHTRISHKIWIVENKEDIKIIQNAFHKSNELYIADGHHRSASSSLLSNESDLKGKDFFMSFLVDEEQIEIFNFNRLIKNIDNQSTNDIIDLIGEKCSIKKTGNNQHIPTEKDEISMYIDKCWYSIKFDKIKNSNNLVKTLDPALLFDNILEPVFNIKDERKDKNLEFIDGKRPLNELQELVDSKQYSILFILKPISIHQIKEVADNKQSMPPKSTYIEPKLRSGLIIYELE